MTMRNLVKSGLIVATALYVPGAAKVFDAEGRLTDAALRERLRVYIEQFTAFVSAAAKPK